MKKRQRPSKSHAHPHTHRKQETQQSAQQQHVEIQTPGQVVTISQGERRGWYRALEALGEFLKGNFDKFLLVYLLFRFWGGITDPAKLSDAGQRAADFTLGALIGLIQGHRYFPRRFDIGGYGRGAGIAPRGDDTCCCKCHGETTASQACKCPCHADHTREAEEEPLA